ncbi:MAG: hypothetical protein BGO69_01370 [Bacteroidetes bacterium 46-16]|nr:MAG: hypothetical protein BGO69_01370 [Bacteroidetes bacterium 46-16]
MNTKDPIEADFWVLKSVSEEDRSYISIVGYNDDLTTRYEYDSNVPNHKNLKVGDIVIIIDKEVIHGFAKIAEIETAPNRKTIKRCPVCGATNFEARKTKQPVYRCNRGHEFDAYVSEVQDIVQYKATYSTFIDADRNTSISLLRPYYSSGYNRNMSIQKVDPLFFASHFTKIPGQLGDETRNYLPPEEALEINEPEGVSYKPDDNDEREGIFRQIKKRRGQQRFRDELRKRYGCICMITGCNILDILEAAHISPYRGEKDNDITNGLLLRADIHTLFDLNLIGIHPDTLIVYFADEICDSDYHKYNMSKLIGCTETKKPSREALLIKWRLFIMKKK